MIFDYRMIKNTIRNIRIEVGDHQILPVSQFTLSLYAFIF